MSHQMFKCIIPQLALIICPILAFNGGTVYIPKYWGNLGAKCLKPHVPAC